MVPDADGYPLNLNHWGEVHNSQATPKLIDKGDYLIADKSYDSHSIRDKAHKHGMKPVMSKRKKPKKFNHDFDSYLYKLRHLVKNIYYKMVLFLRHQLMILRHSPPLI